MTCPLHSLMSVQPVPVVVPSPAHPVVQPHVKLPGVLVQVAW